MSTIVSAVALRDEAGYLMWECQLDDGQTRNFRLVTSSPRKLFEFMRDMDRMGLGEDFFRTNPRAADIAAELVGRAVSDA